MLKAVLIGISLIICCFTTIFFSRYITYAHSVRQLSALQQNTLINGTKFYDLESIQYVNYNQSHPVIKSLTRLIEIPLIGQFFMDQKIYQLAKMHHWNGILDQIQHIIRTPANKLNFAVWFHKALAECNSGLIEKCQESAKTVELIAGTKHQKKYSAWFYQELKSLKRGKNPTSFVEIQEL